MAPRRSPRNSRPATTSEAREHELVNLAEDLAERQLREGSASAQVISHYLKLGSSREQLEQARLRHENQLLAAKKLALDSQRNMETLYAEAIAAMRRYSGQSPESEMTDDYGD